MQPCIKCRYVYSEQDDLRCRKRKMQKCSQDGSRQILEQVNGYCNLINQENGCPEYKPKLRVLLRELFMKK